MFLSAAKTKIIWGISSNALHAQDITDFASFVTHTGVDGIKTTLSPGAKENIKYFREALAKSLEHAQRPTPEGWMPLIMSLQGRTAKIHLLKPNALERKLGSSMPLIFLVSQDFILTPHILQTITESSKTFGDLPENEPLVILVSSEDMIAPLKTSSVLQVSFGHSELTLETNPQIHVQGASKHWLVKAKVTAGGSFFNGSEIHANEMPKQLFPLTLSDETALEQECHHLADYLAIPGTTCIEDLIRIKKICLEEHHAGSLRHPTKSLNKKKSEGFLNPTPKILLKIDSLAAVQFLNQALAIVDGVIFSRGELGLNYPPNALPILQKEITAKCNHAGKIIILENELMSSMSTNPNPTRAEVSDIVNAVSDGIDALILETSITEGVHKKLVSQVTRDTILSCPNYENFNWTRIPFTITNDDEAIAWGAIHAAKTANAKAIVCITEGGFTAQRLSSLRASFDIVAITFHESVMRQLNLLRGVRSLYVETPPPFERILDVMKQILYQYFSFSRGERFVFVSLTSSPVSAKNSNLFSIQEMD